MKRMKNWHRLLFLGACLFFVLVLAGCGAGDEVVSQKEEEMQGANNSHPGKLRVVASFYPVYDFATQVGGEDADVEVLIPQGVEPHDWEPDPSALKKIKEADLFIYNGAGFEPWVDRILQAAENGQLTVVDASTGVPLMKGEHHHHHGDAAEAHADDGHEHESHSRHGHADDHQVTESEHGDALADPHIWLDPVHAQQMVKNILRGFQQADPVHGEKYRQRAEAYLEELETLHQEYAQALGKLKRRTFITSHAAFGYLAARYNLEQKPILGLSPEAEPTPESMAELARFAQEHQVKVIFFESLVNPKVAEVLAKEVGAQTLPLNPIEGLTEEESKKGETYLSLMRKNLQQLLMALND